ncbi:MAG: S8/S53 family peptidase, partial [Myxococcota bacterium]
MLPFRPVAVLSAAALFAAGCSPVESTATFTVESDVIPLVGAVDGLGPGDAPRPTGTLVSDSGVQADFVLDEVMIVAPAEADLQPLLDRYDGAVVGRLPLRNEDATSFLVRLDPMTVDPAHLTRDLARTNPDASGDYTVDADASLALLAVVAREARELGASISPNWVPQPQSIASGSTEEAPTGPTGYDPDVFQWTYMQEGGVQDMGVTSAWQILDDADKFDNKVGIAIVDSGMMRSDDMPTTRDIVEGTWDQPVPFTCGGNPCPWHGTQAMLAAMAEPDNEYGTAGPGGPVAELVAVPWGGGFWGTTSRMATAIDLHEPRIVSLSLSVTQPLQFVPFGPGFLPALDPRAAPFWDYALTGTLFVAAAGNAGTNVNADDATDYTIPCQISTVMCVGGLSNDSTDRHPNSNFGSVDNGSSVEIYGPYTVWSVNDPSDPDDNSIRAINGTSFATPHVAGIAALVMAADPSLDNFEVRDLLNDTAQHGNWAGNGSDRRVDAQAAVASALGLPTVEILEPSDTYSVSLGTEIVFEAVAENAADDDFQLVWDLAGDTEVTNEGGLGRHTLFYDELPPGTHTITASAQVDGVTVSDAIEVTIEYDGFDIFVLSPSNGGVAFANEELQLTGHTSSVCCLLPEGDVGWRVLDNGQPVFTDTGHTVTVPKHLVDPGTYIIEFQGTDGVEAVTR